MAPLLQHPGCDPTLTLDLELCLTADLLGTSSLTLGPVVHIKLRSIKSSELDGLSQASRGREYLGMPFPPGTKQAQGAAAA